MDYIKNEETEYMDNMPDNLQGSERYEKAENAVENLENAFDIIDTCDFDEIIESLNNAAI